MLMDEAYLTFTFLYTFDALYMKFRVGTYVVHLIICAKTKVFIRFQGSAAAL